MVPTECAHQDKSCPRFAPGRELCCSASRTTGSSASYCTSRLGGTPLLLHHLCLFIISSQPVFVFIDAQLVQVEEQFDLVEVFLNFVQVFITSHHWCNKLLCHICCNHNGEDRHNCHLCILDEGHYCNCHIIVLRSSFMKIMNMREPRTEPYGMCR